MTVGLGEIEFGPGQTLGDLLSHTHRPPSGTIRRLDDRGREVPTDAALYLADEAIGVDRADGHYYEIRYPDGDPFVQVAERDLDDDDSLALAVLGLHDPWLV